MAFVGSDRWMLMDLWCLWVADDDVDDHDLLDGWMDG